MNSEEPKTDEFLDQSNRVALASPGTVVLAGETWRLSPFTPADHGKLMDHARELALADVQSPLQALAKDYEHLPPVMQAAAMREAVAQSSGAKKTEPTREALAAKAISLPGVQFSFWLSARKLHPTLTLERARELVKDDDRYTVMEAQLDAEGRKPAPGADPKANGPAGS